MSSPSRRTRTTDDRGTALVEFAFLGVIFFAILFGIISISVLLALKQNVTQAVSEAARAAIAVQEDGVDSNGDERKLVAQASLENVVGEFDVDCSAALTRCEVKIHECSPAVSDFDLVVDPTPAAEPSDPCLTTFVRFANSGDNRILPAFPIVSSLEPDFVTSQSTVHLVPVAGP